MKDELTDEKTCDGARDLAQQHKPGKCEVVSGHTYIFFE